MAMNENVKKWLNRLIICVILLGLLSVGCYYALRSLNRAFFTENPRFMLTRENVQIKTPAAESRILTQLSGIIYADFNKKEECSQIWAAIIMNVAGNQGLSADELPSAIRNTKAVNLFSIDFAALRKTITQISTIRYAEIEWVLPDKLMIKVYTRSPIAILEKDNGDFVCDGEGKVMERNVDEIPCGQLPVILGLDRKNFRSGISLGAQVTPALTLIEYIIRKPDLRIRIAKVSMRDPDKEGLMSMICYYRPNDISPERKYLVVLPTDNRLMRCLEDLVQLLRDIHHKRDPYNYIRMTFDTAPVLAVTNIQDW